MANPTLVFDFDRTIISGESLELVAAEALAASPQKEAVLVDFVAWSLEEIVAFLRL